MKKVLIPLIFCFVFVIAICFSFFFYSSINGNTIFRINEGDNIVRISENLEEKHLISNKNRFKIYSKFWSLINGCAIVHVGEYEFNKGDKYSKVLDKICNGKSIMKTITIPEGFETREVVEILNNDIDFIGNKIVFYEEGNLLPETYSFKSGIKREVIFDKMKDDFNDFVDREWKNRDKDVKLETKQEAIILASIVEKEAKTDEERPIIASVYLNRLRIGMKLDADPTAIYEITRGKYKLNRLLTKNDLKIEGDYNTYKKKGLPIGPICNPGKKSIYAVLHPAKTTFLYFVAKEDLKGHYFSENYKDHLQNIKLVKLKNSEKH